MFGPIRCIGFTPHLVQIRHLSNSELYAHFYDRCRSRENKVAIIETEKNAKFTFKQLIKRSQDIAGQLLRNKKQACLHPKDPNVLLYADNRNAFHTMTVALAAWSNDWCFVPVSNAYPATFKRFFVEDNHPIASFSCVPDSHDAIVNIDATEQGPENAKASMALVIYTSGTTGKPKGVCHTADSVLHQILAQSTAWRWSDRDVCLHTLPLYHIHGLFNTLLTPLFNGATIISAPSHDTAGLWRILQEGFDDHTISFFSAVPTIYSRLNKDCDSTERKDLPHLRLAMSGSAPLPQSTFDRFQAITEGVPIVERFGASEIGMALSGDVDMKQLSHDSQRKLIGTVGRPITEDTRIRLVDDDSDKVLYDSQLPCSDVENDTISGRLMVSSPSMFSLYKNRPKETDTALKNEDGVRWYDTGDSATLSTFEIDGKRTKTVRINGRTSVDVIKRGGFKVSALDVETILSTHPAVRDVVVFGMPDEDGDMGEVICAVISSDSSMKAEAVHEWAKDRMPRYWVPTRWLFDSTIVKRNPMGKVNKKQLKLDIVSQDIVFTKAYIVYF